ncbi:DUF981 family protein [Micromonospora lupini]|uniref:DUF981 family protein n=1 Tax=Micromonospora lupini TaxID=285679 RepID=UPI002254C226|nr:DUF981 family protein [Micromonospora lupini]MCX5070788.1 DUF981 family protein [Micromonospora lupini]
MIMFNTLMGVAAGGALILVPHLWAVLTGHPTVLPGTRRPPSADGWASAFGVLGGILTLLGLVMTVTHPLASAAEHIDTLFGEPSLLLGLILLAAAWFLQRQPPDWARDTDRLRDALTPMAWVLAAAGVVLAWCVAAIVRFNAVGAAPVAEPITGLLHDWPWVENSFFAALYGLAALGCLLAPAAVRGGRLASRALYWSWTTSGVGFLLFAAMNFYTHTGMLININTGAGHSW